MKAIALNLLLASLAAFTEASPIVARSDGTPVTAQQYADLVRFTRYAAAAYNSPCPSPNGAVLVQQFSNSATDTQGYVARDDVRKEIIVALRGTSNLQDFYTDSQTTLVKCASPGVAYPSDTLCHTGFQNAYNSVAAQVISIVRAQTTSRPGYSIKVTGHSLGGSLSSLASLSMRQNFPSSSVTGYSYGQPRTGDVKYANFFDSQFPFVNGKPSFLRAIHTSDGVPQVIRAGSDGTLAVTGAGLVLIPNNLSATSGYRHHSTEFWQTPDPASQATTVQCKGQEDPTCQDSLFIFAPAFGINPEHIMYFNMPIGNPVVQGTYCFASA